MVRVLFLVWSKLGPDQVQNRSNFVSDLDQNSGRLVQGSRRQVQAQVRFTSRVYSSSSSSSPPSFFRKPPSIFAAFGFFSSSHSKTFSTPHSTTELRESGSAVEMFFSSMHSETTLPSPC